MTHQAKEFWWSGNCPSIIMYMYISVLKTKRVVHYYSCVFDFGFPIQSKLSVDQYLVTISQADQIYMFNSALLHYNEIYHVCRSISGYFIALAWNCLTSTLDYIIMEINTVNHDWDYYLDLALWER